MDLLISLMAGTVIMMLLFGGISRMAQQGHNHNVEATAAGEFQDLLAAARSYAENNAATLQVQLPVGSTRDLGLAALNLVPGFSQVNPYGQTWHVYMTQLSNGVIAAYVSSVGGQVLPLSSSTNIAALTGSHGGFVGPDNIAPGIGSQVATGSSGGWQLPLPPAINPGPGHLFGIATSAGAARQNSDALYRDVVPNHPEYNTMNAPLNMGGNDISAVGNEQVNNNLSVGNQITAQSAKLAAGNNLQIGNASMYADSQNAAIRAPGQLFVQHPDGSLAPVSAGSVTLPAGNNLTEGSASFYGDDTNAAVRTPGQVLFQHQDGSSAPITASTANVTTGVQYSPTAALGASCGQPGLTTGRNDGSGEILSCTRGIWQSLTFKQFYSYLPPTTTGFKGYASANPATGSYSCQAGTADTYGATFWYGDYGYSTLHICQPQ